MSSSGFPLASAGVAACLALTFLAPAPLPAQPLTPGAVQETLRPRPPSREQDISPPAAPAPAPPRAAVPADQRRVRIARVVFSGNTLYSDEELRAIIADQTGAELTLADIYALADRLTEFYQGKGYSLTTVTVPAQRMQDGVLRLEVVEGRVGRLVFTGNERYGEEFLAGQLDLVQPGTVLRFADLEREVLLLNDLPGLLARSLLVPGEEYGTTDLNLRMEEKPVAASAVLDNSGRKVIGKWRLGADFTLNNPLGRGDALGLGYTHSQSNLLRQGRLSYGLPVLASGSRLNLSYSRAEYEVGEEFAALDIAGVSETARLQFSHPFLRSRRSNLSATVGAAHVLGQSDMLAIPISDDEINYFEAGLNFSHRNATGGLSSLSGQVASNFRSNADGRDSKSLPPRLELRGEHEHFFAPAWSAALRGEAVWSSEALPDSNKYSLGGPASVRGFVASWLRGDRGLMGSLELRRGLTLAGGDLLLRGFVDTGKVYHEIPLADGSDSQTLASAGLGLTASFAGRYVLDLQWARPIDGKDSGDGLSAPLWVTVTALY